MRSRRREIAEVRRPDAQKLGARALGGKRRDAAPRWREQHDEGFLGGVGSGAPQPPASWKTWDRILQEPSSFLMIHTR